MFDSPRDAHICELRAAPSPIRDAADYLRRPNSDCLRRYRTRLSASSWSRRSTSWVCAMQPRPSSVGRFGRAFQAARSGERARSPHTCAMLLVLTRRHGADDYPSDACWSLCQACSFSTNRHRVSTPLPRTSSCSLFPSCPDEAAL
jgi:hypothetical protein